MVSGGVNPGRASLDGQRPSERMALSHGQRRKTQMGTGGTIRQQGQRGDRGLAWPPRPGGHPALVAKPAVSRAAWPPWQGLCHAVGSLLQPFLPFVVILPWLVPSREGAVGSYSVTLKWGSGQRLQIVTEPPGGAGQVEAVRTRQQ